MSILDFSGFRKFGIYSYVLIATKNFTCYNFVMENLAAESTKEGKVKKGISAQTRLILAGLAVSTVFILCTASFAVYSIDKNMNSAYRSFAQVLAKTLAIEGVELTKEAPQLAKYDALRTNSRSI